MTSVDRLTAVIVETSVFGVKGYHYLCECGEKSKVYPNEATAANLAKKHHKREMEQRNA